MAFHQKPYQSGQNNGFCLASTHSCLDGVPFKISPLFIPPQQPEIPQEVLNPAPFCEAFHDEYDYDTEEGVLAWARAREEAKAKALAERQSTLRARAAVAAAESDSSSEVDDVVPDNTEATPLPNARASVAIARGGAVKQPPQKPVKPPWQLPAGSQGSNSILTPVQAAQAKVTTPKMPKAQVDLALFEQEGDPFDNLELQTIDDMEELRTLLGGTNVGEASQDLFSGLNAANEDVGLLDEVDHVYGNVSHVVSSSVPSSDSQNLAASSASDLYANILPSPSGTITEGSRFASAAHPASGGVSAAAGSTGATDVAANRSGAGCVIEPTGDGDYIQIKTDYSQQGYQHDCDGPIYSNIGAEACLGGELPQKYTGSKMFKPVLPPLIHKGQSMLPGSAATAATNGPANSSVTSEPLTNGEMASGCGRMTQSAYYPSPSAADGSGAMRKDIFKSAADDSHTYSNVIGAPPPVAPRHAINLYSRYSNTGGTPFPAVSDAANGILRITKSNPDLSASSQAVCSSTEQKQQQPWNPYKPLPPTPQRSSSSSSESLPTDCQSSPSLLVLSSPSTSSLQGLPEADPFNSLTSEAKTFVNNLTAMGFSRSRAARAVQKYGADEKEVIDHLFNVDKLVERKHTAALAEIGLQLFKNDVQKAEQFLDLYQQFIELGFSGEQIQTALVQHQLDRDKALDYLTT